MVTGGFRVVLLAVSLAVAAPYNRHRIEPNICETSATHMILSRLHHCTTDPVENMPSLRAIVDKGGPPEVADIARFAHDYCTIAIPNGMSCFQDRIRECNATFQAEVSQLAEKGNGILCQPGGSGLNPFFSAVLDDIDDEELLHLFANDGRCPRIRRCPGGLPSFFETQNFSLDELVRKIQRDANDYVKCSFKTHRYVKDTCPYWRSAFLVDILDLLKRALLGVHLSFTSEELEMLTEAGSNHA